MLPTRRFGIAQILVSVLFLLCATSVLAQAIPPSPLSVESFRAGLLALEKQDFRTATDAFRAAYLLDTTVNKYLHYFAKALFLAEMKNRDSVRFVQSLLAEYEQRGGEDNTVQRQKAQILAADVVVRLEALLQDSLQAAQRQKAGYVSGYQYSYQATARNPSDSVVQAPRIALAGRGHFRLGLFGELGAVLQSASSVQELSRQKPFFDQWGGFGIETRGGFWQGLSPDMDWGVDGILGLRFGTLVDSGSIPTLIVPAKSLQRLYEAESSVQFRLNIAAGTLGVAASAHLEYVETVAVGAYKPILYSENYKTIFCVPQGGFPFHLVGAGAGWEPRDGEQGLLVEGRYYFLPILGTVPQSSLITGKIGYSFSRAALIAEGALANRVLAGELVQTVLLRLGLRWFIIQAGAERER